MRILPSWSRFRMIERKHRRRPSRAWIVISNNVLTRRMTREAQKESHETNRPTRQADALPEGMAIVPVECLEVAERAIHLLQFNTSKNAREYGAITDALNAVLAAKENGE